MIILNFLMRIDVRDQFYKQVEFLIHADLCNRLKIKDYFLFKF